MLNMKWVQFTRNSCLYRDELITGRVCTSLYRPTHAHLPLPDSEGARVVVAGLEISATVDRESLTVGIQDGGGISAVSLVFFLSTDGTASLDPCPSSLSGVCNT